MPYIAGKETRKALDKHIDKLAQYFKFDTIGILNYIITKLLLKAFPISYKDYNALIGVLESCKLEFYRRKMSVYENTKIAENGDVY